MAKHFYHIPLQNTLHFIKEHKSILRTFTTEKKVLEYHKLLGKSYYCLQIETFMAFIKINKELDYALNTLEYFNSAIFLDKLFESLNFSQFDLEAHRVEKKDFFYAFCYLYRQKAYDDFELFMQKTFLHYHAAFNTNTNIHINHKEMCHALAKTKKIVLKESFGEEEKESFFKILLDGRIVIDEKGERIKRLRKKAYKKLFYYLIEWDENIETTIEEAYRMVEELENIT